MACLRPDYSRDQFATEVTEGTEDLRTRLSPFLPSASVLLCGSFLPM